MACPRPALFRGPETTPATMNSKQGANSITGSGRHAEMQEARRGLLRAMWQTSVAPRLASRFSSKPIAVEDYFSNMEGGFVASDGASITTASTDKRDKPPPSHLTKSEREYLESLLHSEDVDSIRRASVRLADKELFPPADEPLYEKGRRNKVLNRRDSEVQQQLFRLHECTTVKPSIVLRRMSSTQGINGQEIDRPSLKQENSIAEQDDSWGMESDDESPQPGEPSRKWNPFTDINSWLDGNQGVEVDDEGNPNIPVPTCNPFKIIGTSADDVSCHPHVLSPPLMEGLQAFMPESLQEQHYFLKYSLVRDGPSLINMLRHCRASAHTILAIETTDGHVFGSFTSQPWRLSPRGFYGSKDSFVWKMRRSRNDSCHSIVEQVLLESKIDVFPFTGLNNKVQLCMNNFLALGAGEVRGMGTDGTHFDHAIRIDASMETGSTSSCETFGSPSLINTDKRGEEFVVSNIELWTLTPHSTQDAAVREEMNRLFLEEGRSPDKLNLLDIMVGSPGCS